MESRGVRDVGVAAWSARGSRVAAASAFAVVVAAGGSAFAQGLATNDPLKTYEDDLTRDVAALSTSDCVVACKALASIKRSVARICELDAGERCAKARAKEDEATRKVRDACPTCSLGASTPPSTPPAPPVEATSTDRETREASAPPQESKRGGCAGCSVTSRTDESLAGLALGALAIGLACARRRQRRA